MMCALGLDVMVLTVFLASEVTLVFKMGHVILQVPVSLLEVSLVVVLNTVHQLVGLMTLTMVIVLEGSLI